MLGIVLRILCFSGYSGSDDGAYAELGYLMASGQFDLSTYIGDPVFPLRLGLIAPTALGFKLTGPDEIVMIAYPFILSLLGIILVFFAGRAFFNIHVGLISASILAILPIDIRMASQLLPDLPASFWSALGVFCLYLGSNRQDSRSKALLGFASGLCFGMSWMCKETILYLLPFVAFYLIWLIKQRKSNIHLLWGTGLTLGGFWIVESLIYFHLTQDFLFRLHETARNFDWSKDWFFSEGSRFGWAEGKYAQVLLKRLLIEGPQKIFFYKSYAMVTGTAALACIYGLSKKPRVFAIVGSWFLSLAFMFNFASTSLHAYTPLVLRDRYMYSLLFPAIICVAGGLNLLVPKRETFQGKNLLRLFIASSCVLIIGGFSIYKIQGMILKNQGSPTARRVSHLLTPQDPVFTDSRTAWVLIFFWGYPAQTKTTDFEGKMAEDIPENAYILINPTRLTFLHRNYGYEIPVFTENIPEDWELKWQYDQARLYWKSGKASHTLNKNN